MSKLVFRQIINVEVKLVLDETIIEFSLPGFEMLITHQKKMLILGKVSTKDL